jgi:hypothetical protein
VTTADLIALKKAGVPSSVIAAMIGASKNTVAAPATAASFDSPDPLVPHPAGVYMLADWLPQPKMLAIDATTSNQTKTGGFLGYALTGGLAPMNFKAVIPNQRARTRTAQSRRHSSSTSTSRPHRRQHAAVLISGGLGASARPRSSASSHSRPKATGGRPRWVSSASPVPRPV